MLGFYAFLQAAPGPLMPFLRAENDYSYTVGGLHFSAFALGMMAAGLTAELVVRRFGRKPVFWVGAAGMAAGAVLLALGAGALATIGAALMMGLVGSHVLVVIQAGLADHHGSSRAVALTEANVMASLCAGLAPLSVGLAARWQLGWRAGLLLPLVGLALIAAFAWRTHVPPRPTARPADDPVGPATLPSVFWLFWIVLVLGVSVEWSLVYWGAAFLEQVGGLPVELAAATMSVFFIAAVIGRLLVSRLARQVTTSPLLLANLLLSLIGFLLFWLARVPALNVLGLFLAGLGISNVFPLGLAAATGLDPEQSDRASARILLGGGLAIFGAPFVLGWLADRIGLAAGYGTSLVLILLAIAVMLVASRFSRAPARQAV